jgi:hypothetical protein
VEQALREARSSERKSLILIVGRGLHSGPEGPRIKPEVLKLINTYSLRVTVREWLQEQQAN